MTPQQLGPCFFIPPGWQHGFLLQSKDMDVRLTSDSNLAISSRQSFVSRKQHSTERRVTYSLQKTDLTVRTETFYKFKYQFIPKVNQQAKMLIKSLKLPCVVGHSCSCSSSTNKINIVCQHITIASMLYYDNSMINQYKCFLKCASPEYSCAI